MPVSPERWRALSPYLDEALEIPTGERGAWLASIQERDGSLAADLRAMLHEHQVLDGSRFLEQAVLDPTALRVPFFHSNIDKDEVLFYHRGQFFSRAGIGEAFITHHPQGLPHGPQAAAIEA